MWITAIINCAQKVGFAHTPRRSPLLHLTSNFLVSPMNGCSHRQFYESRAQNPASAFQTCVMECHSTRLPPVSRLVQVDHMFDSVSTRSSAPPRRVTMEGIGDGSISSFFRSLGWASILNVSSLKLSCQPRLLLLGLFEYSLNGHAIKT